MTNDNLLPFCFPAVDRKKITAAFDGGRISSDGGVMLLAQAERRLGIADQLARVIPDERDASRVVHLLPGDRVLPLLPLKRHSEKEAAASDLGGNRTLAGTGTDGRHAPDFGPRCSSRFGAIRFA